MGQEKSVPAPKYNERFPGHQSQNNSASVQYSQVIKRPASFASHSQNQLPTQQCLSSRKQKNTSSILSNRKSTSSIVSCATERSTQTSASSSSEKSTKQQTKYLNEHLYIKSYLDIEEEKTRNNRVLSEKSRSGLRNYTPKILTASPGGDEKEVDVWI